MSKVYHSRVRDVNVSNRDVRNLVCLLSSFALTLGMGGLSANAEALAPEQQPLHLPSSNASSAQNTSDPTLVQNSPAIPLSTYLSLTEAEATDASALLPESSLDGASFTSLVTSLDSMTPDHSQAVSASNTLGVLDVAQAPSATSGQSSPSGAEVLPIETTNPSAPVTGDLTAQTAPSSDSVTQDTITPDTAPDNQSTPLPDTTPAQDPAPTAPLGIEPGRATRTGSSYIGIGGNIGLGEGDTALGEGSFAVFSKVGLTPNLSIRPAVLVSDDPTILLPVTFDFIPGITRATEAVSEEIGFRASPYFGPGIAISTGDDGALDFLLTGGVDIPITQRFTATAAVNASFFDNIAVGLLLGVGVNF